MTAIPTPDQMHDGLIYVMRGINAQVFKQVGNRVLQGPFKGMTISLDTTWDDGNWSAKLFGSYEVELQGVIAEVQSTRKPKTVINVGCAEGYYAVGLAMTLPDARIVAVDIDENSLMDCRYAAKENGVAHRMQFVRGCKSPDELNNVVDAPLDGRLYVMDCEGHELELLDMKACPSLLKSDIIVECHDFMRENVTKTLLERFCDTHDVKMIQPMMPPFERYDFVTDAPSVVNMLSVMEKRPMPTSWLTCWARREGT